MILAAVLSTFVVLTATAYDADPAFAARAKQDGGAARSCGSGQVWIKVASKGDTYVRWVHSPLSYKQHYFNSALRTRYINTHKSSIGKWQVNILNKNGYLYTQATYSFCS